MSSLLASAQNTGEEFVLACKSGQLDRVTHLLPHVDVAYWGEWALLAAVRNARTAVVHLLLKDGRINVSAGGFRVVTEALRTKDIDILVLLFASQAVQEKFGKRLRGMASLLHEVAEKHGLDERDNIRKFSARDLHDITPGDTCHHPDLCPAPRTPQT